MNPSKVIFSLTSNSSIAHYFMNNLRDTTLQAHKGNFRQNLKKIGYLLAYEISKELSYQDFTLETALGNKDTKKLEEFPVLIPILRAGLPLYEGFAEFFEQSDSGFVGAYRGEYKQDLQNKLNQYDFDIDLLYTACPNLEGKTVILIDPMLATGKSLVKTYQELSKQKGMPKELHIAAVIASKEGVKNVNEALPHANLWIGDIDDELDKKSYIVPGLGDAGDLSFGEKV
ncbi:uracil phosphoribosyltransferase [Bernardetia sp.]|uniref:uracil phosphoribosyltransferase n=1 Tax=Bernardetia sp. TaxID=1937974 RepID=UPI0025C2D34B|nr:uracil phosphoribosyltransferase [Bernardetia sp.]